MQHDDPFENSSYRTVDRRIPWIGVGVAGVLIAALTWMAGPDRANHGGTERKTGPTAYTRDQAAQTMTAMGYHSLVGLTQDADGSWHAEGSRDGAQWRLEVSPHGAMNAQAPRTEDAARAQPAFK